MFALILKFFFVFLFNILLCIKMIRINSKKLLQILLPVLSIALAILTSYLDLYYLNYKYLIPLLIIWITMSILSYNPQKAFVASIISFGISYSIYALSSLVIDIVSYTVFKYFFSYWIFAILSGMLQSILIATLLRIKRFKNSLSFLLAAPIINLATLFCIAFVSILIYARNNGSFTFAAITFTLLLAFLIFWWQAQITKAYRHQLELRASESLRAENARLLLENRMLIEDKDRMAYITHRDNTLITTLKNATLSYLSTDYSDPEDALKARDELIANIEALSAGRASLPDNYNEKQARTFDTNFTLLNKLLHQMDADAIQQNIMFSVHFGVMLDEFVPRDISEMDLVHTVDDLLKNAFKATRNSEPRMVQLQFYRLGKHFVVEVADNGIPFEVRSLVNMGMEKLTTYEDGSGIGLVDIWSTKEKCGATYHLEEYVTPSPFSKKISLTFDKKNRYSIRTWRKDEILQMSRRADLQVYEHME